MKIMVMNKKVTKIDMYQKRKMRAEKKCDDNQQSLSKVVINW